MRDASSPVLFVILAALFLSLLPGATAETPENRPVAVEAPSEGAGATQARPVNGLTLSGAVARVLENNPRLSAFAWDIRAADAAIAQARLRPNPELSVEIEDIRWTPGPAQRTRTRSLAGTLEPGRFSIPQGGGQAPIDVPMLRANPVLGWEREKESGAHSGFREAEVTISLAQVIELGGKRAKRVAVAEKARQVVLWDYEAVRADVLAETARVFVGVLAAQQRCALQSDLVALAEEAARGTALRVRAGQVSPLEAGRAEVALAMTRIAGKEAERALTAARARLAALWNSKEPRFDVVVGDLDYLAPVPPAPELAAELAANPDVARWAAELDLREAHLRSERAQRTPDLEVELGFRTAGLAGRSVESYGFDSGGGFGFSRSDTGHDSSRDNRLVLGFSLPLPVFDRNQGNAAAAEHLLSKTNDERLASESAAWAALVQAREEAAAAAEAGRTLVEEVLPKATETLRKTRRGYQQGKFNYLDVLDSQRTLFELRTRYLDALERYHVAAVEIERLTGRALRMWTSADGQHKGNHHDE